MNLTLNVGAAVFALGAAVCWFMSARVDVPEINQAIIGITVNPAEKFNAAIHAAAMWNSYAAGAACVSAACQSASLLWGYVR